MSSFVFDADRYGPAVSRLWTDRLCELGPGTEDSRAAEPLAALTLDELIQGRELVDAQMGQCCFSALWLWYDFLDESHTISQNVANPSGSYWHGIMHRREPDYSNAKYWFRRVGEHPAFETLRDAAAALASANEQPQTAYLRTQTAWDPFRFVDACQQVYQTRSEAERLCREVARIEWQILFDYCYHAAVS